MNQHLLRSEQGSAHSASCCFGKKGCGRQAGMFQGGGRCWVCNNIKSLLVEKKCLQAFHKSFPYLHYYFFPYYHRANWKTIHKTLLCFGSNFRRCYGVLTQSFHLFKGLRKSRKRNSRITDFRRA